jgi:sialidase-1
MITQVSLFKAGQQGYHTYRIPALVVSLRGTALAFCEGRKHSTSDAGKIDLLLKRSFDGGLTWESTQLIAADDDNTCGNPCPVVDQSDGTIWLPFCKNLGMGHERLIVQGQAPRTVWITKSVDDGASWSEPREITDSVKPSSWTWYATGPTHGIQLTSGRLVIPCDHVEGVTLGLDDPLKSHVIYSDDHGISWQVGGSVEAGTDECAVVETASGAVYMNCRGKGIGHRRAYAWSQDGGVSFGPLARDETLVEPQCQASLVRMTRAGTHDCNRVLFSNPARLERERMTVRISYDECETWPVSRVLYEGPAAYSDLCVTPDLAICCLYERGREHAYEELALARFSLDWLTRGDDGVFGFA